jgi:ubiquinone/menaquinone biosynthesis C-methylase UbiE
MQDLKGPGNGALLFCLWISRIRGHNVDMDPNIADARESDWSRYWSGGALHSCADSYGGNYAGAIGAFWADCFAGLVPGHRVLDLATGNGPLPLLLWERAPAGKQVCVDAVDLARVAPRWHDPQKHAGLHFHSGIRMERLPFAEASFDLVISQFGIEYARWPDALHEAVRVMKPQGSAAFVVHHSDSVLCRVARSEQANQEFLLAGQGLLSAASEVIPWISLARRGALDAMNGATASACRQRYNLAMQEATERIEASQVPDLLVEARAWIHGLLSGAHGTDDPVQQASMLADYRDTLHAALLRTTELLAHALDVAQVEAMGALLRQCLPAHDVRCVTLSQAEGLLGWGVRVSPASSTAD